MKKISIYLLLMAFFAPLAMMGQESLNEKKISHDNTPTLSRGGSITVYKRVTSPTSGRNYLIVSSQTANSDALAMSQVSSTATTITASSVHINPALSATGNAVYINSEGLEPSAVWKATKSGNNYTFSHPHGNPSTTYYIYTDASALSAGSLTANTSSTNWAWGTNQLSIRPSWSIRTYYITPSSSGFSMGTSAANVYLYEETEVDAYTVTASVSPSGVGRVTGDGVYVSGLTCTLTATTNNSDYDFVNWTENGVVVSTNPTYSFTVSDDHNVVANFESNVTCPEPINLIAGTPSGHSVPLTWTSEAESFNVRYRTLGAETTVFFEDFEDGLGNWTTIRNSGGTTNTDWQTTNSYYYQGSNAAVSRSWYSGTDYNVDNWLITPRVTLDGILKFWVRDDGSYHDHYDVYVSTTGNSIDNFSLLYEPGDASGTWTEVTVDLSAFEGVQGYIGLRHTDNGKEYLLIDNFGIYGYTYGNWSRPISTTSNPYTLTGLDSQTTYQAEVQANCGGGDLSAWSNRANFITTAPSTVAPTNLTVSAITINSATASWQGVAANDYHQSYDLYYATSDVTSVPASPTGPNFVSGLTATSYDITGLRPETEYHVWVRDYCGTDGYGNWSAYQTFTTLISCYKPTGLTASDITPHTAMLSWTENGTAADWVVEYATTSNFSDAISVNVSDTPTLPLTDLSDATTYYVRVKANCGDDDESKWSDVMSFTTYDDCVVPFSQSTTDITPSAATLNWDGMQSSYNVRYRLTYSGREQTIENFSGYTAADADDTGELPTGWKGYSSGTLPHISNNSQLGTSHNITSIGGGQGGTDNFLYMISNSTSPNTSYTILPKISHLLSVSFNYAFEDASHGTLTVGYCTENTSGSSFVAFNDVTTNATTSNTQVHLTANDIATINQHNGYLAFRWVCSSTTTLFVFTTTYGVAIDNVTIDYVPYVDSGWTTEANVNSPLDINGLVYNTEYEWQAQGVDCDGNGSTTNWSASTIFTTLPAQEFTKTINAYNGEGGYYLIASPIEETTTPSADNGFITTGDYDFYYFDQSDPESKEWVNYDTNPFNVVNGKGYLYASANGTTLSFVGTPYRGNGQVTLSKDDDAEFIGWNLVGNPFPEAASLNKAFYTMNPAGDEVIAAQTNSVAPMEGVFVIADSDNETLTFTMTNSKNSMVALNLSNGNNLIDRAVVNFGEARTLPKFQLNPNHTKVYIPQDGMNYAVVSSEEQGEMPVSFKAENNGNYSISFATEEVNFAYLHLIDNMTGIDVDLLETPSYSFEAKSTDYEGRFKLVFVCGDTSDDTFAFYNNGSWVINNEGEATLQVIDVNGRILKSESINGNSNIDMNAAAGVYMLRLVNGDNVKVQKVVVR